MHAAHPSRLSKLLFLPPPPRHHYTHTRTHTLQPTRPLALRRGGYFELVNFPQEVKDQLYKVASISLCPNVSGQVGQPRGGAGASTGGPCGAACAALETRARGALRCVAAHAWWPSPHLRGCLRAAGPCPCAPASKGRREAAALPCGAASHLCRASKNCCPGGRMLRMQICMALIMNPPKPGDPSYELYARERDGILEVRLQPRSRAAELGPLPKVAGARVASLGSICLLLGALHGTGWGASRLGSQQCGARRAEFPP